MRIDVQDAAPYVTHYLGGRGIAAWLFWEEYPVPIDPWRPPTR
jgi:aldehyde:ferredoxin oxidoreductase